MSNLQNSPKVLFCLYNSYFQSMADSSLEPKKHIIIFSHGHGVRQDDRGLLSDIARSLPEVSSILFDYYQIDEEKKTMLTCPFSVQAKKLNRIITAARQSNPEATIDIIGHSQGTLVVALARPEGIRKTILLAPVFDMSLEYTLARYRSNPEADINLNGISRLPVLDGLLRIVPPEYWRERLASNPIAEYNELAVKTEIIAISARQDQLLPAVDLKDLDKRIELVSLDGDHNFNGEARAPLIAAIRKIILDTN